MSWGWSGREGDAVSNHYRPLSRPEPSPSLRRYGERVLASAQTNVIESERRSMRFKRSVTELVYQAERFAVVGDLGMLNSVGGRGVGFLEPLYA